MVFAPKHTSFSLPSKPTGEHSFSVFLCLFLCFSVCPSVRLFVYVEPEAPGWSHRGTCRPPRLGPGIWARGGRAPGHHGRAEPLRLGRRPPRRAPRAPRAGRLAGPFAALMKQSRRDLVTNLGHCGILDILGDACVVVFFC